MTGFAAIVFVWNYLLLANLEHRFRVQLMIAGGTWEEAKAIEQ